MANLKSTTIADTGFLQLPAGTTAQRPQSPSAGEIRFNTDTKVTEWYDDQLSAWFPTGFVPPVATGGDTVEDVDIDGVTYRIHSFTTVGSNNFTVTRGGPVDFLIAAGGGGGGSNHAGGGGAGGVLQGNATVINQSYTIVIGTGGSRATVFPQQGFNGQNSSAFGFTALGGGGGGCRRDSGPAGLEFGLPGGSGGGGGGQGDDNNPTIFGGSGTPGQGNNGGTAAYHAGAGGGGAAQPGETTGTGFNGSVGGDPATVIPGNGGNGIATLIRGTAEFFGGGGGGGGYVNGARSGSGGLGGGGTGQRDGTQIVNGTANTGGGGGGANGQGNTNGGNGGSGIVIVRYRIS